jgi:hypothetical protein
MRSPHLLNLGNCRKVKSNLIGILDSVAIGCIEAEIESNAIGLFKLARSHYSFAVRQPSPHWRQRISRLYYAAYNTARAVRLYVAGEYSTHVKDHQKLEELPDDFPNRSRYVNQLSVLREDRNTCDYDHTSKASDLVLGTGNSTELVRDFLDDAGAYLRSKGMIV